MSGRGHRPPDQGLRFVYGGRNAVAGARLSVECLAGESGYFIRVGRSRFHVARSDGRIRVLEEGRERRRDDVALTAPAAVVSLALQGYFCFHASAVETPRGVLAFMGRSGKGKSTLAAHLARSQRDPWDLLSDDVLPVALASLAPVALRCDFPRGRAGKGERLPLKAVYVLRNSARRGISVTPVGRRQAFITLVRHSVALQLFDTDLKAAHFDACASASGVLPVKVLRYPRRLSVLDQVRAALEADLESSEIESVEEAVARGEAR